MLIGKNPDNRQFCKSGQLELVPGVAAGTLSIPDEPASSAHAGNGIPNTTFVFLSPRLIARTDHTIEGGLRRIQRHIPKEYEAGFLSGKWRMKLSSQLPLYARRADNFSLR